MPPLEAMKRARQVIRGVARHTPLVPAAPPLSATDTWLKLETFQPTTSFKIRGIFHAVSRLSEERRSAGLLTVSAGNTAQALAWAGRHFGVPAQSLMPKTAPRAKIEAVESHGGSVRLVETEILFRFLRQREWESEPAAFIHPWIEPDVMLGHASLGLELVEDLDSIQSVFVPVGGGGLMAGVASAVKSVAPHVRIYAVEPATCAALHQSLIEGRAVAAPCETMCDGVAVPYLTPEIFPLLRQLVDETVLVPEEEVAQTIRDLAFHQKVVAEPSGALALAAARRIAPADRGRSACIVTGGSIDPRLLCRILSA